MKEYLFLFRGGDDNFQEQQSPEKWQAQMQKWMQWMGGLQQKGVLVGAQPLARSGKQVTGIKKVVTDGPFVEGKEAVGGYMTCKASSYEEAVEIAKGCPILDFDGGRVEVRETQQMSM